jgi:hypothetical protein
MNLRKKNVSNNSSSRIKPQQKMNHRPQQVAEDYQPGDNLMEGTPIFFMMNFIALAQQMGHEFKDTLHDYWLSVRQLHTPFYSETMIRDRFFAFCRQFTET